MYSRILVVSLCVRLRIFCHLQIIYSLCVFVCCVEGMPSPPRAIVSTQTLHKPIQTGELGPKQSAPPLFSDSQRGHRWAVMYLLFTYNRPCSGEIDFCLLRKDLLHFLCVHTNWHIYTACWLGSSVISAAGYVIHEKGIADSHSICDLTVHRKHEENHRRTIHTATTLCGKSHKFAYKGSKTRSMTMHKDRKDTTRRVQTNQTTHTYTRTNTHKQIQRHIHQLTKTQR